MSNTPHRDQDADEDEYLDADEAAEEITQDDDDVPMSDDDQEEIILQNDSIAYFDIPQDSLFSIAQHPLQPSVVAVGGAAGSDDDAPGMGYIFSTSAAKNKPVLPPSFASDPSSAAEDQSSTALESIFGLEGHTDSIGALSWTLPSGEVLLTGGMDGRLKAWRTEVKEGAGVKVGLLGETQEVEEVSWIAPCPSPSNPNAVALGAVDGSVWVYTVDPTDKANPLQIVQSYFLHTGPCTAGAWTPDGQLLATVSEDNSFHVWDVWGTAAAQNLVESNGQTAVSMSGQDQRFEVDGGFTSIAIDPKGTFAAVGGFNGEVKIVSLPRVTASSQSQSQARGKSGAQKNASDPTSGGQILASLHTQSGSIETIAIALTSTTPPTVLVATGSVDSSICIFDATRRFALRRHIVPAHGEHAVVKLEFIKNTWLLTSCGLDGVVKRWDLRGGVAVKPGQVGNQTGPSESGLIKEWKGHRGDGEGGGVLGFVQGETGERLVTAGDDGIALVFEA